MNAAQKVLIVEDEMIVQLHLKVILEELGYVVSGVAATADEAFASAAKSTPDLVLMDIRLPGGPDGIEAARELRIRYGLEVVFLTAYADEETVSRTQEIRALGYIVKPFSMPQIRAALATAFTKHGELKHSRRKRHSLASVLGSMDEAIIATDREGAVTFLNPQAAALTGTSPDKAQRSHILDVFRIASHTQAAAFGELMEQVHRKGETASISRMDLVSQGLTARTIRGEIKPLRDGSGSRGGLVLVFKEIPGLRTRKTVPARIEARRFGAGTRMAFYSHDTFGLGHLQRCLNIARTLVDRFPGISILLVTGSPAVHRYTLPPGVDYVKLPAVRKVAPEKYESRSLGLSYKGMVRMRSNLVLQSIRIFDPHVLLVDHAPVGMKGEILPTLEWLKRNRPSCIKMIGLRDILDDPETVAEHWKRKGIDKVLWKYYEHILIYGTPEVFDPASAYGFTAELKSKTYYCNYIPEVRQSGDKGPAADPSAGTKPLVVVTIGGGDGAGEVVIGTYLEMLRRFGPEIDFETIILPGPFLDSGTLSRFQREAAALPSAMILEFVSSTSPYMTRSDLIVATAGYNTMTQMLMHGQRALVIPRVMHRKEQLLRARRFEEMGLVTCLHPDDVTPERLHGSIKALLADPTRPLVEARSKTLIPLDGTERLADFCGRLRVTDSGKG